MNELLAEAELPAPDRIEYWEASVAFFWDEPRLVLCVDLDPDDAAA